MPPVTVNSILELARRRGHNLLPTTGGLNFRCSHSRCDVQLSGSLLSSVSMIPRNYSVVIGMCWSQVRIDITRLRLAGHRFGPIGEWAISSDREIYKDEVFEEYYCLEGCRIPIIGASDGTPEPCTLRNPGRTLRDVQNDKNGETEERLLRRARQELTVRPTDGGAIVGTYPVMTEADIRAAVVKDMEDSLLKVGESETPIDPYVQGERYRRLRASVEPPGYADARSVADDLQRQARSDIAERARRTSADFTYVGAADAPAPPTPPPKPAAPAPMYRPGLRQLSLDDED